MNWLARPHVWFPLLLLATSAAGAYLLADPECTPATERELRYFWARRYWQCAFDATSAACGVGLLTFDLNQGYSPRGRWVLTGIGLAGALLFVAAATQGWRRLALSNGWPLPLHPLWVVALFTASLAISIAVVWIVESAGGGARDEPPGAGGAVVRGIAAGAGVGLISAKPLGDAAWPYAVAGWLSVMVCAVGAVTAGSVGRVGVRGFYVLTRLTSYVVVLLVAAIAYWALEAPRGSPASESSTVASPARNNAAWPRAGRALLQTTAAAGAGFSPTKIGDRGMSEGGKMLLATTILVGGIAGGPAAGISWALLLAALGGVWYLAGHRRIGALDAAFVRTALAGGAAVIVTLGLTFVVASALLILETHTASKFQSAPTFADAFLDAASAVGGASLTSGVTATVTSENLTQGIGLPGDLYQYGMTLLIGAMLCGRWLPVLALGWAAGKTQPASNQNPLRQAAG